MEKEEIIKRLEELDKKKHSPITKYAREHLEKGDYVQAAAMLFDISMNYRPHQDEAKEVAKLIVGLYAEQTLRKVKETAETDRVSAKISLLDIENRAQKMEMALPPEYEETRKFVYGLAPEQEKADEKLIFESAKKESLGTALKMLRFAKESVRTGHTDNVEVMLNAVKMTAEAFSSPLPPEYPEGDDWKKAWKDEALEHVKGCVKEAQKYANEAHGNKVAKSSLDEAKDYASQFGLELPSEYENVLKLVEEKERKRAEEREQLKKRMEETRKQREETVKKGLSMHLSIVKEFEKSGYSHDTATTRRYLKDTKSIAENGKFPLPPEYDDLLKLVEQIEKDQKEGKTAKPAEKYGQSGETAEKRTERETVERYEETAERAWKVKVKWMRSLIGELKSSDKRNDKYVESAYITLRNMKSTAKINNKPLPEEFYELKGLVNWKDETDAEPPAQQAKALAEPKGKAEADSEDRFVEICIKDVKKYLNEKNGVWMAKTSLESARTYAKSLGLPLPSEYDEAVRLVEEKEKGERARFGPPMERAPEREAAEKAGKKNGEYQEAQLKGLMENIDASEGDEEEMLPYYDEAEKRWRIVEKKKAGEKATEIPKHADTEGAGKRCSEPKRTIKQEEVYGLRKELEGSGNARHSEALDELRGGHFATAAHLIDMAAESDNVHISAEMLKPLYEEAVRDLLNGAMAVADDRTLLRGRLEEAKKYVSKLAGLPEDLSTLYELLCSKTKDSD